MHILRENSLNWNTFGNYNYKTSINFNTWGWQSHSKSNTFEERVNSVNILQKRKINLGDLKLIKFSRYNISKSFPNGETIIYNTSSEALVVLTKEEFNTVIALKNNDIANADLGVVSQLYLLGIYVDLEEDELFKINFIRNQSCYSRTNFQCFVIYPTTKCNARCFYCFNKEIIAKPLIMNKVIALQTVKFIVNNVRPNEEVIFRWFGGEPLLATKVIDFIIEKFQEHTKSLSIIYNSIITTNGSLINMEILEKFKKWNVTKVFIPIDGASEKHNLRKNYIEKKNDYYISLLKSIELLLNNNINVTCRLNLDLSNFEDFYEIINTFKIYHKSNLFTIGISLLHPPSLNGDNANYFTPEQYNEVYKFIYEILIKEGLIKSINDIIPKRSDSLCNAKNPNAHIIYADGNLFRCEQESFMIDNCVGHVESGIRHNTNLTRWVNTELNHECVNCCYLPICQGGCEFYRNSEIQNLPICNNSKYYMDALMDLIYKSYLDNI